MITNFGVDSKQLAGIFGISETEVKTWPNFSGVQMNYVNRASIKYMATIDEDIADAYKKYKDRPCFIGEHYYNTKEIGKIFGISPISVAKAFHDKRLYGWKCVIDGNQRWITTAEHIKEFADDEANEKKCYSKRFREWRKNEEKRLYHK